MSINDVVCLIEEISCELLSLFRSKCFVDRNFMPIPKSLHASERQAFLLRQELVLGNLPCHSLTIQVTRQSPEWDVKSTLSVLSTHPPKLT